MDNDDEGTPGEATPPPGPDPELVALVTRARDAWAGQLVDLGGRNTLLHHRDLAAGTLDLGPGSGADPAAVTRLLAGDAVRLTALFDEDRRTDAARRADTIRAKAAENFEERGLRTLFLAWGLATWAVEPGAPRPAAAVLLRQLTVTPRARADGAVELELGGEWEVNPTLLYVLDHELGVAVTARELLDLLDGGAPDPAALWERLGKASAGVEGFAVADRVVAGNFSYAKLPMVRDLEEGLEVLLASPLVGAIAGHAPSQAAVRARQADLDRSRPDTVAPGDEYLVLDADASQSAVIDAVTAGADLVVEGPPGTGKSQTIANLIATLAARGERVLFVAEKRAAIDAVLGRLERVGLGDLVLDLHDGVGSKRQLAQSLAHTLSAAGATPRPDVAELEAVLERRRGEAVAHDRAVHERRPPWDVSVYDAHARLTGLPPDARSSRRLDADQLRALTAEGYAAVRLALETFSSLGGLTFSSGPSPWATALEDGTVAAPADAEAARAVVVALATRTWPETLALLTAVTGGCGLAPPATVAGHAERLRLVGDVAALLEDFEPSLFDLPLPTVAADLAPAARGALRRALASLTDRRYRAARARLQATRRAGRPVAPRQLGVAAALAADVRSRWADVAVDEGAPRVAVDPAAARAAYDRLLAGLGELSRFVAAPDPGLVGAPELSARLSALAVDTEHLFRLPELTRLRRVLLDAGLAPVVAEITDRGLDATGAVQLLDGVWLASVLEHVAIHDPAVGAFDGAERSRGTDEYRRADKAHLAAAPERVRRAVARRITAARDRHPMQSQLVTKQASLMRRHLPVRDLYRAAPDVLAAVKPCWAMSPLVVAQLLPMQRCFDVVVFDEASQVGPADAVGALARAARVVVAGDRRQLPPTRFFNPSGSDGADDGPDVGGALVTDIESVLDQLAALLPAPYGTRTLGWHYRSRDERLIAFSNAQESLYDHALTTFPGVDAGDAVRHVHVPWRPSGGGPDDSASDEVAAVVELVRHHARNQPERSLGVIALGRAHADRVTEALRRARLADDDLDAFARGRGSAAARLEPLFVKNLERVQGDERDAVILTLGYGPGPDGRMRYRFGPLNQAGGERRLNVAVTRARAAMTVVSSFTAADLDPARLSSEGARLLRRYLTYAASGGRDLAGAEAPPSDPDPFERDVEARLAAAGIPVVARWGSSTPRIDLAAQHPVRAGEMVLAIECDGRSYHAAATARDRDRLRQEHLERLGWRYHRIWSTDWYRRPDREVERALEAYRLAVAAADSSRRTSRFSPAAPAFVLDPPAGERPTGRKGPMPVPAGLGTIGAYDHDQLVALLTWIRSDTLLRTEDELLSEAMAALGFRKRGKLIVAALGAAIEATADAG